MKQVIDIITVDNDGQRVIFHPNPESDMVVMYDNGADTPVWTMGVDMLLLDFPDAYKDKRKFILRGFGSKNHDDYELTDVYIIPEFVIYDGVDELVIHNLYCSVVDRKDMLANLILPGNIFSGMLLSEDRRILRKHKFLIDYSNKDHYVICQNIELTKVERQRLNIAIDEELLNYTSSFIQ